MEDAHIAYCLSQADAGWIWRLLDEMGEVIANGFAPDRLSAERCLFAAFDGIQLGQARA